MEATASPPDSAAPTEGWREDPRARPDTIARLEKVLELLSVHGFVEAACRQAHCSKETFYSFKDRYPDFAAEAEQAADRARIELEAAGWACARKAISDPRYLPALIFALKAKAAWRDSMRVDIGPQLTKDPCEMTDQELEDFIEKSRRALKLPT